MLKPNIVIDTLSYIDDVSQLIPYLDSKNILSTNCFLLESSDTSVASTHHQSLLMLSSCLKVQCDYLDVVVEVLNENGKPLLLALYEFCKSDVAYRLDLDLDKQCLRFSFSRPKTDCDAIARISQTHVLSVLRALKSIVDVEGMHRHAFFCGGLFSYDLVASFESMPEVKDSHNTSPDYCFYVAEHLLIVDHLQSHSELLSCDYASLDFQRHSDFLELLGNFDTSTLCFDKFDHKQSVKVQVDRCDDDFKSLLGQIKPHIIEGDVFQIVPSRTYSLDCPDSLYAYQCLRHTCSSPYMFYFRCEDFVIFGSSPESAVKYEEDTRRVSLYPIAGSKPRGFIDGEIDDDLDSRFEFELKTNLKEIAEHAMLVDLARNDVACISKPGTRKVSRLMEVVKYSHVMHLYSIVEGELDARFDAFHAYQVCMNMGTLTGAPKLKANALIREYEGQRRGCYGGAIGYFNGYGDFDTAIVIRSSFVRDDVAYVQSGVGLVYHSDFDDECLESKNKAMSNLRAIAMAHGYALEFDDA